MPHLQQRDQCPCCGYYTLDGRGGYDICPVCFWEDDSALELFSQPGERRLIARRLLFLIRSLFVTERTMRMTHPWRE
jgi:hypothetical protein